jgi:hypothetical protein
MLSFKLGSTFDDRLSEPVRDCWERMREKQIIALVAAVHMFPEFDREERLRFKEFAEQFEGYEAVKQLNDFTTGWCV